MRLTYLKIPNARDENHEIVIEIFISKKKHIIFTFIFIILFFLSYY